MTTKKVESDECTLRGAFSYAAAWPKVSALLSDDLPIVREIEVEETVIEDVKA